MAVPTTLHIGRPGMQCTPGRVSGPGGAGLSPCRGPVGVTRIPLGGGGEGQGGGRGGGGGGLGGAQGGGLVPSPCALGAQGGGQIP